MPATRQTKRALKCLESEGRPLRVTLASLCWQPFVDSGLEREEEEEAHAHKHTHTHTTTTRQDKRNQCFASSWAPPQVPDCHQSINNDTNQGQWPRSGYLFDVIDVMRDILDG